MSRRFAVTIVRAGTVVAALCGVGFTQTALAEESRAESRATIEEIIVTARKREESVQDVPIAMTALTQEIKDSSVRDITDLNAYLPNVIIDNNMARSRGSAINIRGLSYTETDKSFDPPVAVVLDGIFIGTSSGQVIENFDIERLEVLRGPQGTLFGKNTVGGVISAVRSRPTGELGGQIQLTGGKWGQQEVRAIANLPQYGDMLSTKLFYTLIKSDGHMDNTFLDKDGPKKDYQNYGAALLFEPNEQFEALLTVEAYTDDSDIGASKNANDPGFVLCDVYGSCRDPATPDNEYSTDQQNDANFDTTAVSLTMKYDINENLQLVSVSGWRDEDEDTINEFDGSSLPYIWIDNDNTHEQLSTELRLEGTYDKFNFVLGGYLWENKYDQNWVTYGFFWDSVVPGLSTNADTGIPFAVFGIPIPGNAGLTDLCLLELVGALRCDQSVGFASAGLGADFTQLLYQKQKVNSQAVFFQGDYDITDKWTVTAGIRWTREEKEFTGAQSYLAPLSRAGASVDEWAINLAGEPDIFDDSTTWKEWTPKVGANYNFSEDIMFYVSYSEGFHSGGYFGRNQNAQDFANTYDPEYADTWEIGMKSQFFDDTVQLNIAAFYNDFQGKQESTVKLDESTDTVVTVIDNVGSVDYFGAEFELRWVVNQNLNLFASLGLLDAEYNDFCIDLDGAQADVNPTSDCGVIEEAGFTIGGDPLYLAPQDESHLEPKFAPKMTFGAGGTYTIPVGPGALDLHVRYNHIAKQETALDNAEGTELDSADFVNASASYYWDRYRITLYGRNLTDEQREVALPVRPLFQSAQREPGTSWGIEVGVDFGG